MDDIFLTPGKMWIYAHKNQHEKENEVIFLGSCEVK